MLDSELRRKVGWLIAIRAVISTILWDRRLSRRSRRRLVCGRSVLLSDRPHLRAHHQLRADAALRGRKRWLVDLQLGGDAMVVSAFIYFTGGITSYFTSVYVLPIVAGSTVRFRRGGLLVATLSTVLYVSLVVAQYMAASGLLNDPWLTRSALALPGQSVARYTVALNVFRILRGRAPQWSLADSLKSAGARCNRLRRIADLRRSIAR